MKIIETNYYGRDKEVTLSEAIQGSIYTTSEDQIGRLSERIEKLTDIVAKLVSTLVDNKVLNVDQVNDLLGYGYSAQEDEEE